MQKQCKNVSTMSNVFTGITLCTVGIVYLHKCFPYEEAPNPDMDGYVGTNKMESSQRKSR